MWFAKYRLPDGRQVQKRIGPAWTGRGRPAAGHVTKRLVEECALASPAVPVGPLPRYTVPDFVGKPIAAASRWVAQKTLYFTERLGPLKAGDAPTLFANYRITAQHPAPGTRIVLGIGTHNAAGTSGTFTPTPLTITADQ